MFVPMLIAAVAAAPGLLRGIYHRATFRAEPSACRSRRARRRDGAKPTRQRGSESRNSDPD